MDFSISDLISIMSLLAGGGGVGWWFTWRYSRRKEKAEAKTAEADAAKELQDVYQQLIADIKTDRDEQKAYISELKEDRRHLREDRDDLRKRQDELEETVRNLQKDVARNGRMVECMRPLLCGREGCAIRVPVTISATGEVEQAPCPHKTEVKMAEIEPYDDRPDA
jgi:Tfp pilus assembly protein PilO